MNGPGDNAGLPKFATVFFVACFLILAYFLVVILRPFFSELLWASVLTVVFLPLFRRILTWSRGRRTGASVATCLIVLLLFVLPVSWIAVLITQQSVGLYRSVQSGMGDDAVARIAEFQRLPWVQWALSQAGPWLGRESLDLRQTIEQLLTIVTRFLLDRSPSLLKGFGEFLLGTLLMFIAMFFLFRDGHHLLKLVERSNPLPAEYESEIIRKFQDVSYATFFGSLLTAMVQGLAGALLFWILGLGSPLFWGAIIAFVSLIPIVGAFLIWIPWGSYLILMGQTGRGIALLALGGLLVSSIDNVLKPIIIQGRTNMHPLLVFLSVLGGMQAFGIQGIILGPLIVTLFVAFLSFYQNEFKDTLQRKLAGRDGS